MRLPRSRNAKSALRTIGRKTSPSSLERQRRRSAKPNRKKSRRPMFAFGVHWRRIALGTLAGAGALAAGILATHGGHELYLYATQSEALAIEQIEVSGNARSTVEEVLALAQVERGDNLLALDVDDIAQRVEQHPWVARASVRRLPPRRLTIQVEEHQPVVLVALESLYYANADGEIVKRWLPGERELLPVVTGLGRDAFAAGDGRAEAQLRSAIAFLEGLGTALGDDVHEIDEIHVDEVMGLTFSPRGERTRVRIGLSPWEAQLRQWKQLRREMKDRGISAGDITLGGVRRPERAVARLQ